MKTLANATVTKLKEYSQSYGQPETIKVPFINVLANEIHLLNEFGKVTRIMRKGTKLLIDYNGTEISERAFKIRTNKASLVAKEAAAIAEKEQEQRAAANQIITEKQLSDWIEFIKANPDKVAQLKEKISTMPSSKWRNLLRMKAAKYINLGKFDTLMLSAPQLKSTIYSI